MFYIINNKYKKFASLMSPTTSSVAQNLFYAQNQLIDITYIQKLSTFFKYYNILKRKKISSRNPRTYFLFFCSILSLSKYETAFIAAI